jgi:Domain of unknown function (DUF6458)
MILDSEDFRFMGIGAALFVFAVGAILAFAVKADPNSPINLNVVGWILIFVSVVGFGISVVFWSSWGGIRYFRRRRATTVIADPLEPLQPLGPPVPPAPPPATLQDIPSDDPRRV